MKRMLNQNLIDFLNSLGDSLKYESSSNTFEIGTNLYAIGDLYTDTGLIIAGNPNNKGASIDLSDTGYVYLNGANEEAYIEFDIFNDLGVQIGLTDKNTKTFFGKSILKDSENNNIDLYRHQLTFLQGSSIYFAEIISSSNLKVDSLQKLATLTKATTDYKIVLFNEGGFGASDILVYNGSIWEFDIAGEEATFSSITDTITTI